MTSVIGAPCLLFSLSLHQSLQWAGYVDEESDPAVLRSRQHVYKEMLNTEQAFIEDLKIILDVS